MKKKVLIVAILIICLSISVLAVACVDPIEFQKNGFRILQIADIQYTQASGMSQKDVALLDTLIKETQPDMIVLTGDNTSSEYFKSEKDKPALLNVHKQIAEYFDSKNIPWTTVFGNHDAVGSATKFELLQQYLPCKNFVGGLVDTEDYRVFVQPNDLYTNYSIPVYNKAKDKQLANLMLFDTGTALVSGDYAPITQEQTDFYTSEYNRLKSENGGVAIPTLIFTHQPLNMHKEMFANRKDAQKVPQFTGDAKELGNAICCPKDTSILENAMLANKDVVGVFTGHDHLNYYAGQYNALPDYSVVLASCRQSGYGLAVYPGMTPSFNRGARVVEIREDGTFATADVQCKATNAAKTQYQLIVEEILKF